MKRLLWLLAVLVTAVCLSAAAEDLCTLGPENEGTDVYTADNFLCVSWDIETEAEVSVRVSGPSGVVYQRDYGLKEGSFTSEEIYLEAVMDPTSYQVTLTVGSDAHIFWVERTDPQAGWDMDEVPMGQSR